VTAQFRLETRSELPLEVLFARSLSIDDHLASMAASGERAVAGVTEGQIGLGETVTWRARHFGVTFAMTSCITELTAPRLFIDQQVKGPFKDFHHEHRFSRDGGVTTMTDIITFTAPFGPLGRLVERLVLRSYLQHLIGERNTFLCRPASPS
jgi:ligand-binding SRPBCC domain-containing protein